MYGMYAKVINLSIRSTRTSGTTAPRCEHLVRISTTVVPKVKAKNVSNAVKQGIVHQLPRSD